MSERRALLLVMDIALVNGAILTGLWAWTIDYKPFSTGFLLNQVYWFPALSGLWLVSAVLNSFYDGSTTAHIRSTLKALVLLAGLLMAAYLFIYFLASSPGALPRRFVLYFIGISFAYVGVWRYVYIKYLGSSPFQRRAIMVGGSKATSHVIDVIRQYSFPHYHIVGAVKDGISGPEDEIEGVSTLGMVDDLPRLARRLGVSEIIVTSLDYPDGKLVRSLVACQEQGIQITPLPELYEGMTGRIPLDMVEDGWIEVLPLKHASTGVIFPLFKRIADITLALLGLAVLIALFPLVALAIRLDSPGAVFYRQDRIGRGGRRFRAYKFRSMSASCGAGGQSLWTEPGDLRVTRVGRILRATHIDEFPQFWNILKGDMSAVGPRPERVELAEQFDKEFPFYRLRHSVRPGMAGWALINQGNTSSVMDAWVKLEYDLYYIKHQSVWLDIVILLKTLVDGVTLRGR
jgi:exopolysaccharide biosynthesis polyprenyl glycosylphosphotransferase